MYLLTPLLLLINFLISSLRGLLRFVDVTTKFKKGGHMYLLKTLSVAALKSSKFVSHIESIHSRVTTFIPSSLAR